MKYIWLVFAIELIVVSVLNLLFWGSESLVMAAIFIHIMITLLILRRTQKHFSFILSLAFFARIVFMLWDVYAKHLYLLPNSGTDSEMFYLNAKGIGENIELLGVYQRGGLYSQINGFLFFLVGTPSRLLSSYLNVLLSLSTVVLVIKSMVLLNIPLYTQKKALLLASFFPNALILSAVMLREMFSTVFVALSLYFFIKWFLKSRFIDAVLSLVMLGFSSRFHSGVVGIFFGYAYAFMFYKHEKKGFSFLPRNIVVFVGLILTVFLVTNVYQDQLLGKFKNIDDISDVFNVASSSRGGSAYLTGLKINNLGQMILYAPLKMLYFIGAPMPWNWRSGLDLFSFFTDSVLYLVVLYTLAKTVAKGNTSPIIRVLMLSLLGAMLVFGVGVGNAGTAIRHRQKLFPVFMVLIGVLENYSLKKQLSRENKTRYLRIVSNSSYERSPNTQ